MKKKAIPFPLSVLRGSIGKKFVVKQTKNGPVLSKFPEMANVVPSVKQVKQRNYFKEAVAYAKGIYADPVQKARCEKKLGREGRLFNRLMRKYLKEACL
jgi:hypothetical protein